MSRQDLYERVIASLHAAALDDARWPETAGLLDEFCGTKGNFLVTGDGATRDEIDIFFARSRSGGEPDVESEREYFPACHGIDERPPRIGIPPDGQVASNASLFTQEEKRSPALYNEAMPRGDAGDSLVVRLDGPGGSRIVWSVGDPVGDGGWTPDRVEAIERLLPHIRHYVSVRQTLADARALGSAIAALLENMRIGIVQLDRCGRLVEANDPARALLRRGDGLSDRDGVLRARLPEEDAELQGLVVRAAASRNGPGSGGSMLVSGADFVPRLVVRVSPIGDERQAPAEGRAGVLVAVVDPARREGFDADRVAALLGLTPTQGAIAALLAEGRTAREIAVARGVTVDAVRWHLKRIFASRGLARQIELVELVRAAGDLAPELRR